MYWLLIFWEIQISFHFKLPYFLDNNPISYLNFVISSTFTLKVILTNMVVQLGSLLFRQAYTECDYCCVHQVVDVGSKPSNKHLKILMALFWFSCFLWYSLLFSQKGLFLASKSEIKVRRYKVSQNIGSYEVNLINTYIIQQICWQKQIISDIFNKVKKTGCSDFVSMVHSPDKGAIFLTSSQF